MAYNSPFDAEDENDADELDRLEQDDQTDDDYGADEAIDLSARAKTRAPDFSAFADPAPAQRGTRAPKASAPDFSAFASPALPPSAPAMPRSRPAEAPTQGDLFGGDVPVPAARPASAPQPEPVPLPAARPDAAPPRVTGLEVPPSPDVPAAPKPAESQPGALARGFVSGMIESNPQMTAETLEGLSHLAPEEFRETLLNGSKELNALTKLSPEAYKRKSKSMWDIGGIDDALTWAGEAVGQGLASSVPSIVTGVIGGTVGSRVGGKVGGLIGGMGGAAVPSAALNYGEIYKALKDEKVDPKLAAEYALYATGPMVLLDTVSVGPIVARLGGLDVAKRELARSIAKRIAVEAAKGMGREGITEAAQEMVKDATVSLAADKPFWTPEHAKGWAESGAAGALTGGAMGGAGGVVPDVTPKPSSREEINDFVKQAENAPSGQPSQTRADIDEFVAKRDAGWTYNDATGEWTPPHADLRTTPDGLPYYQAEPGQAPDAAAPPEKPAVSDIQRRTLRKKGYSDEMIDGMNRDELVAELGEAAEQGVEPAAAEEAAPAPAADNPSAEPASDIAAQVQDLQDPKGDRNAVWLPPATVEHLRSIGRLEEFTKAGVPMENFDDQGGILIAKNRKIAQVARKMRTQKIDMQAIVGGLTGAGRGKPEDADRVIQQTDAAGNVTQETAVAPQEAAAVAASMAEPGRAVEQKPVQDALSERAAKVAAEEAADFSDQAMSAQGAGTRSSPAKVNDPLDVARAETRVNTEPTEAQKEAGNYQKGHVRWNGLNISIENPLGSIRKGKSADGTEWQVAMPAAYGYIKRSKGKDGDQVDVYLGPDHASDQAFIIDQVDPKTGKFDEHKVLLGFRDQQSALDTYSRAFSDGSGPSRVGAVSQVPLTDLRAWLKTGKTKRPFGKIEARPAQGEKPDFSAQADLAERPSPEEFSQRREETTAALSAYLRKRLLEPVEMRAADSDETVKVRLTEKGPWDFNDTFPAPNFDMVAARAFEGRETFGNDENLDVEQVVSTTEEAINEIIGFIHDARAGRQKIADIESGKTKLKRGQSKEQAIEAVRKETARALQSLRDLHAGLMDGFSKEAIAAMTRHARSIVAGEIGQPVQETQPKPATESDAEPIVSDDAAVARVSVEESKSSALANRFADFLREGGEFKNILAARKMAKEAGFDGDAKAVEEAMELAVVTLGREVAAGADSPKAKFTALVDLYSRQPKLGTRTSTSMRDQAFSTPIPLAYAASRLAQVGPNDKVYEPTAGNGALLVEANPEKTLANEINHTRADNLNAQGFRTSRRDAAEPLKIAKHSDRPWQRILANPPFGAVKEGTESKVFDLSDIQPGYKTREIDHVIALRALENMADDGRAVLLLGGLNKAQTSREARSNGYNGKAKREFYKTLYDRYNVVDHFTVAGELYERQGAGWPVDVIVIDGRGKSSRALPAVDVPRVLNNWGQIGELLDDVPERGRRAPERDAQGTSESGSGERNGRVRERGERVSEPVAEPGDTGSVRAGSDERVVEADRNRRAEAAGAERGEPGRTGDEPAAERRPPRVEDFDAAFDAALDETFGPQAGPKSSQGPAAPRARSTGEVAKSAAKNAAESADAAMAGLVQLFGGGKTIGSGISFDEETYAKAKPLFEKAAEKFGAFKDDIAELVKRMVGEMQRIHGLTREALEAMRPYLRRFIEDVRAGVIRLGAAVTQRQEAKPAAERGPARQEQETERQVAYKAQSKSEGLGTLVPVNMRTSISEALADIESRVGSLDIYVADQLGYDKDAGGNPYFERDGETIYPFAAEQIDAIALGIDNIEQGKGFIIGDQCVAGETLIYDPLLKREVRIDALAVAGAPHAVLSLTPGGFSTHAAVVTFKKGRADLYKVTLEDGRSIIVTRQHRFLTPRGWASLEDGVCPGNLLATAQSEDTNSPAIRGAYGQSASQRPQDCLDRYWPDRRPCDEQPRSAEDIDPVVAQLRDDALEHILAWSRKDVREPSREHSLPSRVGAHRSKRNCVPSESRGHDETAICACASGARLTGPKPQNARRSGQSSLFCLPVADAILECSPAPSGFGCSADGAHRHTSNDNKSSRLSVGGTEQVPGRSARPDSPAQYHPSWSAVSSVEFVRHDDFYDLYVPGPENYVAQGFVNHNTGIGKGRVNAAILRWAMMNGRVPVFVTAKPNLYGDMYRDLMDIGVDVMLGRDLRILATNSGANIPLTEDEDNPVVLRTGDGKSHDALMNRTGPRNFSENFDVLFSTYNQMQTVQGKDTARRSLLSRVAPNAIFSFDESHEAGGQGQERKSKGSAKNRAEFARELIDAAKGVFYSSATYAKRPDVMDLYSATDMVMAVEKKEDLAEAIARGGVPMQQVVAAMLAKAGQYIRRERSFAGVSYDTPVVPVDRELYDGISGALADIQAFSEIVAGAAKGLDEQVKAQAQAISHDNATGDAGASSMLFTSVMHNVINQMLLAMKAAPASQMAIEALERGQKPVITVANTMESLLADYAEQMGLHPGDVIDATFGDVLTRYLDRTRTIIIKKPFSSKKDKPVERRYLSDAELGPDGAAAYRRAKAGIDALDFGDLAASPIDRIRQDLIAAGYTVGEITGRGITVDYSGSEPILRHRSGKEKSIRGRRETLVKFNSGAIDVLILNQAGSTGLSAHASEKYKDQRQRHMMIAQAEGNIDTHMQMLGRVHRTGQVVVPQYSQVVADIPAEKRPAAVLAKKMASLNANTTASRGGALTAKDVPDFINEYGDIVAATLIDDDPILNARLADALKEDDKGRIKVEDAMRRVTGRIPLLPLQEQEDLYERLEGDYKALIEQMEASGENALEAKTLDLKARSLERTQVVPPKAKSDSPFAAPVYIEKTSIVRQGKPFSAIELMNLVGEELGAVAQPISDDTVRDGETADQVAAKMLADVNTNYGVWGREAFKRNEDQRAAANEEFDTFLRASLDKIADEKKQEVERNRLNATKDRWNDIHAMLPTGARITLKTNAGNKTAIVIRTERTAQAKNPLALSSWKATFAVADGERQVSIPFSRLYMDGKSSSDDRAGIELSAMGWSETPQQTIERFAAMQAGLREERFIATGNLLAAYDWLNMRGRIINYTDEDGHLRQGILTAKGFDVAEHYASKARPIRDPAEVVAWLKNNRGQLLFSEDQSVRLNLEHARFYVTAEGAKRYGGRYYLDKALTELTGDFYKRGGAMVADIYQPQDTNLVRIVSRLQDLGAVFVDTSETKLPPTERMAEGGEELASLRRSQTDTAEFKRWFGKSKVVDERGEPLVVYHGSNSAFDRFSKGELGKATGARSAKLGFFFTDNTDLASSYADNENPYDTSEGAIGRTVGFLNRKTKGGYQRLNEGMLRLLGRPSALPNGQQVYPVYLRIDNPLEVDFDGQEASGDRPYSAVLERAKSDGHDGVIIRGTVDPGFSDYQGNKGGAFMPSDLFIAFEPTQIKSATANRGTFDPTSDSIVARLGESSATSTLTPAADARRADIEKILTEMVRHIAGPSIRVQFADTLPVRTVKGWGAAGENVPTMAGGYVPAEFLIKIALNDPAYPGSPQPTAFHEAFHAVEDKLLDDREKAVLARETPRLRAWINQNLKFSETADKPGWANDIADYEVRAIAFETYADRRAKGEPLSGMHIGVRKVFEKLMLLFERIRNALRGLGFRAAEDIFSDVYEGKMRGRAPRRGGIAGEQASVRRPAPRAGDVVPGPESVREAWDPSVPFKQRLSNTIDALLLTPSRALWDRQIDLLRFQKAAETMHGPVPESLDTYLAATLYPGRVGEKMKDAVKELWEPIYDAMRDRSVGRDELHDYLYARHAPERNAQIRTIDPGNEAGSGMTDDEAAEVMDALSDRIADFQHIAGLIDNVVAHNRNLMLREGLESEAILEKWASTYQHYVPLKGFEAGTDDEMLGSPTSGRGFDVRRPESERALGRFDRADDILANLLDQTQRAVIRAEKNKVAKTFLRFAQANPSPYYKIGLAEKKRRIDPLTGLVEEYWSQVPKHLDRVFAAKVGGKTYYIEVKHEGLLTALKSLGADKLNPFLRFVNRLTREYSRFQTAKNPEFVFTNLLRDIQDAGFSVSAEERDRLFKRYLANLGNGKALYGSVLGITEKGGSREARRWFEEWREAGGKISQYGLKDFEEIRKEIDRELNQRTESTAKAVGMAPLRTLDPINGKVVKFLEALSDVTETTTRLAVYIAARETGFTKAQAARLSRGATVDFNRRGKYGTAINALYAFANASIQGNIRLLRYLRKSKIARRAAIGMIVAGMLMTYWNMMVSGEDDDKKTGYEKRKYWERERNIIIYWPGAKHAAKIPLGYGLNVFWMIGEQTMMRMLGKVSTFDAFGNVLGTTVDAFNPLGSAGSFFDFATWAKGLFPTVGKPIIELSLNNDWAGRPIHPTEMPWNRALPHSSQHKAYTDPVAVGMAQLANRLTGGNMYEPGLFSPYPDDLEYGWNFAVGGLGRFMANTHGAIQNAVDGVDTPVERMPFVRRFVASDNSPAVQSDAYYTQRRETQDKAQRLRAAIKAQREGTDNGDAGDVIDRLGDELGARPSKNGRGINVPAESAFRDADKKLKELRQQQDEVRRDGSISRADRKKIIDGLRQQMRDVMNDARGAVRQQ